VFRKGIEKMRLQNGAILTYQKIDDVQIQCTLNLGALLSMPGQYENFLKNWPEFLRSHEHNKDVFSLTGESLLYSSEQLIPTKIDERPALMLVLGNPATQSIKSGMFFSYERDKKEHRFWKDILRPARILNASCDAGQPIEDINAVRRNQIMDLTFSECYRVGLCVFITMPSPAGGKWGGVAGIRKLLGRQAFEQIAKEETSRVVDCAKNFIQKNGKVIIFQKDAWENLRSNADPEYSLEKAKGGKLKGTLKGTDKISILGVPPTRLSRPCREVLEAFTSTVIAKEDKYL
jgi:hypothetical protein